MEKHRIGIVFKMPFYKRIQEAASSLNLQVVPFIKMAITEKLDRMDKKS